MEKGGFQKLDVNMKHSKQKKSKDDMSIPFLFGDSDEEESKETETPNIDNQSELYKQISQAISNKSTDAIFRDIIFSQPIFKDKGNSSRKNPTIGSVIAAWAYKSMIRRANPTGQTALDKFWTEISGQIDENTFSKGSYNDLPPKLKELVLFGKIPPPQ